MLAENPFRGPDVLIRTAAPRVESFIRSAVQELPRPRNVRERNLAQLMLAERVLRNFDLMPADQALTHDEARSEAMVKAVEAVAPLYAARFPH